ncbi:MAG: hypothetical protein ABI947_02705, partial [Chloroflexota bacterium]
MNTRDNGWKNIVYLVGAALGLIMGVTAAHLYAQAAEESGHEGERPQIETGDALRIGMLDDIATIHDALRAL